MSEMLRDRRMSDKVEHHDLLSALMNAHSDDLSENYLSDSELMGKLQILAKFMTMILNNSNNYLKGAYMSTS